MPRIVLSEHGADKRNKTILKSNSASTALHSSLYCPPIQSVLKSGSYPLIGEKGVVGS